MPMQRLARHDFLENYWSPERGESVFFSQPTQQGKTHFSFQLLQHTDMSDLRPPVALIMKPRDPTPENWIQTLGYRETDTWPPKKKFWDDSKPPGYALWPKHEMSLDPASLDRTNANLRLQFQRALLDAYKQGDQIVFMDELYGLVSELNLTQEIIALMTRGSGMGVSSWFALQKPSGVIGHSIPGYAFDSAVHNFFGKQSDDRNVERLADISGYEPKYIAPILSSLKISQIETPGGVKPISQVLYINKRVGSLTIIDP